MRFEIVTIFPGFFAGIFEHGIVRRALAEGLAAVAVHDLRAFTQDRHRTVDDRPFGGGEGMVLKPEPLGAALTALGIAPKSAIGALHAAEKIGTEGGGGFNPRIKPTETTRALAPERPIPSVSPQIGPFSAASLAPEGDSDEKPNSRTRVILLSAQGRPFTQVVARELAAFDRIVLICGRYEGVDERVNLLYCDLELSIGDYVLSGGELAAAVVVDAVTRLIPGVLGNDASREFESFGAADAEIDMDRQGVPRSQHGAGGLLDYPHYTRPAQFGGLRAPEVLMNGDHAQIRRWRREQQLRKTLANRPDLLEGAALSEEDLKLLEAIRAESGEI
jgi:tRNA (guanine37-N1)-methyltransferase